MHLAPLIYSAAEVKNNQRFVSQEFYIKMSLKTPRGSRIIWRSLGSSRADAPGLSLCKFVGEAGCELLGCISGSVSPAIWGMLKWLIECEASGDGRCFTARATQNLHYNRVKRWGKGGGSLGLGVFCRTDQEF